MLKKRAETLVVELTRLVAAPTGQARTFRLRTTGWANVLRSGGYNSVHNHPNCMWSGVYCVDRGEPEPMRKENGKLELLDPRSGINMVYIEKNVHDGRYVIEPLPGLMLLFPSWLKHMVHPYFGKGERISVAFNVAVEEAPAETTGGRLEAFLTLSRPGKKLKTPPCRRPSAVLDTRPRCAHIVRDRSGGECDEA